MNNLRLRSISGFCVLVTMICVMALPKRTARTQEAPGKIEVSPGATFTVTTTANTGAGSLRQAITDANNSPGADTINFNIPGGGFQTIAIATRLVAGVGEPVTIDGTTQPGYAGRPLVVIDGIGASASHECLTLQGNSTVRGLAFVRCRQNAIQLNTAGNNVVTGNYIGVDPSNEASATSGNVASGVSINRTPNNRIGGSTAAERNTISRNANGVNIFEAEATGNVVVGNYIGLLSNGSDAARNTFSGVLISSAPNNRVGGSAPGERNVISGHTTSLEAGVRITGVTGSGNLVLGNFIGTDATGTLERGNASGVRIDGSPNNTVGGSTGTTPGGSCTGACNLISGSTTSGVLISNASGIPDAAGNVVEGNFFNLNASGTALVASTTTNTSVQISQSPNNRIGGSTPAQRNVIVNGSSNGSNVSIGTTSLSTGNVVSGNFIGTDTTGTVALGNAFAGVNIGANPAIANNRIGGTTAGERNVISGGQRNGLLIGISNQTLVQGNYIGTDVTGTQDLGNVADGILIMGGSNSIIGVQQAPGGIDGLESPEIALGPGCFGGCNLIAGNDVNGVNIIGMPSTGNRVQGNFIGTNINGTADLGNGNNGVRISNFASNNTIGGITSAARNIISGNNDTGVRISGTGSMNQVLGNFIGTDVTGTADLGNEDGVAIAGNAFNNTIGGTAAGARNIISGNDEEGVTIDAGATTNNVQGNFIGTDITGASNLGNLLHGIKIQAAPGNTIGGTSAGAANVIAFNGGAGVGVTDAASTGNAIRANSIFLNTGLGLDLAKDGITPNDTGDPDTGPNNLQNFPVLVSAMSSGGTTAITGTLNSSADTTFRVEFFSNNVCDPLLSGEGQAFIGSTTVMTVGNDATINASLPVTITAGQFITSTATDPAGNTSEFSACIPAGGASTPTPTPASTPTPTATATPTATQTPTPMPTPTPALGGLEGDLAPRFEGDGQYRANDLQVMRDFFAGEPVNPAFNEFQRADCAPYDTRGDGRILASDVQQIRNYIAVLSEPQPAGGPLEPIGAPSVSSEVFYGEKQRRTESRVMRMIIPEAITGRDVAVRVELDAAGDEVAAGFTVKFDPSVLSNPRVFLAAETAESSVLTTNTTRTEEGLIGVLIDSPTPLARSSGTALLTITFEVPTVPVALLTSIEFGDQLIHREICDVDAKSLQTHYAGGTLRISPSPTPAENCRIGSTGEYYLWPQWLDNSRLRPICIAGKRI